MARAIGLAALPLLIGMLSGCAGSPPVHFYTLSAEATAGAAVPAIVGTELRIAVGPITLPEPIPALGPITAPGSMVTSSSISADG